MLDNRFISTPSSTAVLLSDIIWWNVNDSGGNFIKLSTNAGMLISRNPFPAVYTEKYFSGIKKTFCIPSVIFHKPPRDNSSTNVAIELCSVDLIDSNISIACWLFSDFCSKMFKFL